MKVSAKRILGAMVGALMLSGNAFAMTFTDTIKVGSIFVQPSGGIVIRNATYNSGSSVGTFQNEKTFDRGIAGWGEGAGAIYYHYGDYPPKFGGREMDNAYPIKQWVDCAIFNVINDGNVSLYMIENTGSDISVRDFALIGRQNNGKWVKYFDTNTLIETYFGRNLNRRQRPIFSGFNCQSDMIVVYYGRLFYQKGYKGEPITKEGEFRFKWDDDAQWFSVEQVVY